MVGIFFSFVLISFPITEVGFTGNVSIAERHLRAEIISKVGDEYGDLNISYDVERIGRFYTSLGFFDTKVTPEVSICRDEVTILFQIEEGKRPRIERIVIHGDSMPNTRRYMHVREGGFFILPKLNETERSMEDYFKDRGFPFADVEHSALPDSGILLLQIEKGALCYIRKIEVRGLTKARPHVVCREVELKAGDLYSKEKVYNSQRRIYALGFFSTLNVETPRVAPDSLDLIFSVKELRSRILNFGVGISLPLSFLMSFGLEELNFANLGHRANITPMFKVNIDREWEVKVEGRYTLPYVTSLGLQFSVLPFVWFEEKNDFSRRTRGNEFRIAKVFTEEAALNVSHQYKYVRIDPKVLLPDTIRGVTNSVRTQFLLDLRDEFFDPRRGVYFVPSIQYAGGVFGGENHFIRLEAEERVFFTILNNTVAQRFKVGRFIPTDGAAVYEEFYLGGQYTLRGYPERSLGPDSIVDERYGRILFNFNLEYRIRLPLNFGLVAFFDAGYLDNEIDFNDSDYLKTTAGFGVRYFTPIGPLRLDLGFPLQEEGSELYFGIYHTF
ncbi:MAG: BamA/TamA family outer membrane protein [candidate division WOR-3 bacterium]|nr:MAG: BamA/TamA family outer membrane protein [candidate division WOR-3 bacterium]